MKHERINYTQVVWEITRLLQEAESLEDALRTTNDALSRFIQFYSDHYLEHGALSTLREP